MVISFLVVHFHIYSPVPATRAWGSSDCDDITLCASGVELQPPFYISILHTRHGVSDENDVIRTRQLIVLGNARHSFDFVSNLNEVTR